MGSRSDESIRRGEGWQDGAAALRQKILDHLLQVTTHARWWTFDSKRGRRVGGAGFSGHPTRVLGSVVRARGVNHQLAQTVPVQLPVPRYLTTVLEPLDFRLFRVARHSTLERKPTQHSRHFSVSTITRETTRHNQHIYQEKYDTAEKFLTC